MRLLAFGSLVWFWRAEPTRLDQLRAVLHEDDMTNDESEDAQAQRELDSLARDDDPEPGAFYGLTPDPTHPAPEPTHA